MNVQSKPLPAACPGSLEAARRAARVAFDDLSEFCQASEQAFWQFEKRLLVLMAVLGASLIRLFLTARHERLDIEAFLRDGRYRAGNRFSERRLKTVYGEVTYGRQYLVACTGGSGFFPLDVVLGLTRDRLSPWMMQWVSRLATRMSFAAARMVCQAALNWSPATETIEQVVLGLGRQAAPFMRQLEPPPHDGEVLVIEIDGKCPPTATEAELAKRRGPRRPRPVCSCGCQRHRGQTKRRGRGPKKRRKKGDKGKNGREVTVVVMYTLKRGDDGKLHGPVNKKLWASFAGQKVAALWARAEATKRGFGPDTTKTVQIVLDGANMLKKILDRLFPKAVFTLDICHVVEKLWALGQHFHKEGSDELKAWVEKLKTLVYAGKVEELLERLRRWLRQVPENGPGTKGRRQALAAIIHYLESRVEMMRYGEWLKQDLVIATGQVEGAVRHLVGERLDCSGMRWLQQKAEAVLHLRCIELNGDWDRFVACTQKHIHDRLRQDQRVKILTDQPLELAVAA
jgi:hypothetical protein